MADMEFDLIGEAQPGAGVNDYRQRKRERADWHEGAVAFTVTFWSVRDTHFVHP